MFFYFTTLFFCILYIYFYFFSNYFIFLGGMFKFFCIFDQNNLKKITPWQQFVLKHLTIAFNRQTSAYEKPKLPVSDYFGSKCI